MLDVQQRRNSGSYNEVIVANSAWETGLPDSVDAFLDGGRAREAWQQFLLDYPDKRGKVPLARYNTGSGFSVVALQ